MDSFIRDLILSEKLIQNPTAGALVAILVIWSLTWKGVALWHAAKNLEKIWFIAILLLNTAGIAEIAYLFFFTKNKLTVKDAIVNIKSLDLKALTSAKKK